MVTTRVTWAFRQFAMAALAAALVGCDLYDEGLLQRNPVGSRDMEAIEVGDWDDTTIGDGDDITIGDRRGATVGDGDSRNVGDGDSRNVGDGDSRNVGDGDSSIDGRDDDGSGGGPLESDVAVDSGRPVDGSDRGTTDGGLDQPSNGRGDAGKMMDPDSRPPAHNDMGMDTDSDGTVDSDDGCPNDADKIAPGLCGCGNLDIEDGASAECTDLKPMLLHRYRFDGLGGVAADSVGGADGEVLGTILIGTGDLRLSGGRSGQHVKLPAGILSGLSEATIEMWVTWTGGNRWQRLFDFGVAHPAQLGNPDGCTTNGGPVLRSDGVWYYFCTNTTAWGPAAGVCSNGSSGAKLVRVDDAAEQMFLVNNAPVLPVWIGANDRGTDREGQWSWRVGSNDSAVRFWDGAADGMAAGGLFSDWLPAQPDDSGGKDCGEADVMGWRDADCELNRPFVCEAPSDAGAPYSSLFVAPAGANPDQPWVGIVRPTVTEDFEGNLAFPNGTIAHVVLVYDDPGDTVTLYVDGASIGSFETNASLAELRDENNYLGRSHFDADPGLQGTLHELRIYDQVLSEDLIAISGRAGADPAFLE